MHVLIHSYPNPTPTPTPTRPPGAYLPFLALKMNMLEVVQSAAQLFVLVMPLLGFLGVVNWNTTSGLMFYGLIAATGCAEHGAEFR